ncbi:MAG: hypothetical protein Fues2KO_43500 [Fuerstiella sp.]
MNSLTDNPYDPPAAIAQDETVEHPPWWAVMLMLAGASILGIATGSMTCIGIVTIGWPTFQSVPKVTFVVTAVIAVAAGLLTARRSYRDMVRNYWHNRTPLAERPDMQAPVSEAERFRSSKETFRP